MKKTIGFTTLFTFISDFISLFVNLEHILTHWIGYNEDKAASINNIVICSLRILTALSIILIIVYMNIKRKEAGTHNIPCSWVFYWRYKIKNKNNTLLENLHQDIYHNFNNLVEQIQKTKKGNKRKHLVVKDFKNSIIILLQNFHDIFNKNFNLDLSINIYQATQEDDFTIVKRSIFLRSSKERRKNKQRDPNYKYVINSCDDKHIENYTYQARNNKNNKSIFERYNINSIFDYLMTSSKSSWISNDLKTDEKNNLFFSSSEYYKNGNYKSLAAFAIIPPSSGEFEQDKVRGILTFDSEKTQVFAEEECNMLMGLMAHLIFEVLKQLE